MEDSWRKRGKVVIAQIKEEKWLSKSTNQKETKQKNHWDNEDYQKHQKEGTKENYPQDQQKQYKDWTKTVSVAQINKTAESVKRIRRQRHEIIVPKTCGQKHNKRKEWENKNNSDKREWLTISPVKITVLGAWLKTYNHG